MNVRAKCSLRKLRHLQGGSSIDCEAIEHVDVRLPIAILIYVGMHASALIIVSALSVTIMTTVGTQCRTQASALCTFELQ